ncbi:hypothetical protein JCM30237_22860 [Halolamina litorea]|uniref:Uncharacterized protein n=1 Tax=Halolamina litorea TaxID=1515593 RepID=A0ABD6BQ38_9EURY|nr:hypothetical protein [Halolamina litorea]
MSSTNAQPSDRALTLLGAGSAVMQTVAFTAVGVLSLESIPYGVVAGGFGGVGAFLFLPWFLGLTAAQEAGDAGLGAAAERVSRSTGPGMLGLGFELGAITVLALGFVTGPDLLLGAASGLVVAVAVYLVGSFVIGR